MTRNHFGSLKTGGLNWDSLPLKLFAGGNAKFWDPASLDFSADRADLEALTDREREIVSLLGQGLPSRAIAERLTLSIRTVEGHIYRAMAKTGTTNRDELAALLRR